MAIKMYTTTVVHNHKHTAYVDEFGNGETSIDMNHKHKVTKWRVLTSKNHIHKLIRR